MHLHRELAAQPFVAQPAERLAASVDQPSWVADRGPSAMAISSSVRAFLNVDGGE